MTISPDQLQTAIEGRLVAVPGDGEVARLVRLAGRLDRLRPAGPSAAQSARMSAQFEQVMAGGPRRRAFAVPPPWGERTRTPLIQRFAAGALLFAAVGGGASAATGVSPAEAARSTFRVVENAILNLAPHDTAIGPLSGADEVPQTQAADTTAAAGTPASGSASGQTPVAGTTAGSGAPEPPVPGAGSTPGGAPGAAALPTSGVTPPAGASPSSIVPTSTPTAGLTPTPTPRATAPGFQPPVQAPVASPTPTATPTPSPTATTPTSTPTDTPTSTPTTTPTPGPSATPTASRTPEDDGSED